ncbi:MAG: hypothetical protein U1F43_26260 [Myxococcota bacterium]
MSYRSPTPSRHPHRSDLVAEPNNKARKSPFSKRDGKALTNRQNAQYAGRERLSILEPSAQEVEEFTQRLADGVAPAVLRDLRALDTELRSKRLIKSANKLLKGTDPLTRTSTTEGCMIPKTRVPS